jgi:protein-tyrosine phosphatase
VCMGNICRSPAAEIVFLNMVEKAGMSGVIEVDSAGTIGFHAGSPPDSRMAAELAKRGYSVFGKSRRVRKEDLDDFDLILAMDEENLADLRQLDVGGGHSGKILPFVRYLKRMKAERIPDPYYGDLGGFQHVVDLLEDGCVGLMEEICL